MTYREVRVRITSAMWRGQKMRRVVKTYRDVAFRSLFRKKWSTSYSYLRMFMRICMCECIHMRAKCFEIWGTGFKRFINFELYQIVPLHPWVKWLSKHYSQPNQFANIHSDRNEIRIQERYPDTTSDRVVNTPLWCPDLFIVRVCMPYLSHRVYKLPIRTPECLPILAVLSDTSRQQLSGGWCYFFFLKLY